LVLVVLLGQALIHGDCLVQILYLALLLLLAVVVEVHQGPAQKMGTQVVLAVVVALQSQQEVAEVERQIKVMQAVMEPLAQINICQAVAAVQEQ
jgi:hypothetical protein